jgi:hypothetical protein
VTFANKLTPLVDHLTREPDSVVDSQKPSSELLDGIWQLPPSESESFTTRERVALVEVGRSTVGGYFEMITSLQHGR